MTQPDTGILLRTVDSLAGVSKLPKGEADEPAPLVEETLARFFSPNLLEQCPKPVIAAINGLAFGMGCEIAMGCDIRIAVQSAKFAQPEVNIAVITGAGGSQRLPRLVGYGKAVEMILTGSPIEAEEALQYGLITQLVPDDQLEDAVAATVKKLLKKSDTSLLLSVAACCTINPKLPNNPTSGVRSL